jgi:hypothetical protein
MSTHVRGEQRFEEVSDNTVRGFETTSGRKPDKQPTLKAIHDENK